MDFPARYTAVSSANIDTPALLNTDGKSFVNIVAVERADLTFFPDQKTFLAPSELQFKILSTLLVKTLKFKSRPNCYNPHVTTWDFLCGLILKSIKKNIVSRKVLWILLRSAPNSKSIYRTPSSADTTDTLLCHKLWKHGLLLNSHTGSESLVASEVSQAATLSPQKRLWMDWSHSKRGAAVVCLDVSCECLETQIHYLTVFCDRNCRSTHSGIYSNIKYTD